MARARNIKPGFFRNSDLLDLPIEARLLFIGLWTLADREGRLEDRPRQIKVEIFPADNFDCNELLQRLADSGFLLRYKSGDKRYLQVVNFCKHQNPHKDERGSTIEAPCNTGATSEPIGLNPDSGYLNPEPRFLTADSLIPNTPTLIPSSPPLAGEGRRKGSRVRKEIAPTAETWKAYSAAYESRYNTPPVSNAMVFGQLANFLNRVGQSEAPAIAAWYVGHQNRFYIEKGHSIGILLNDAEKLRTEWATGRRVTSTQAMQADKTQTNANVFGKMIAEAQQQELSNVER